MKCLATHAEGPTRISSDSGSIRSRHNFRFTYEHPLSDRTKISSGSGDRDPGCSAQPCLAVCVGLRCNRLIRKVDLDYDE